MLNHGSKLTLLLQKPGAGRQVCDRVVRGVAAAEGGRLVPARYGFTTGEPGSSSPPGGGTGSVA